MANYLCILSVLAAGTDSSRMSKLHFRTHLDSWPLVVGDTSYRNQFLRACANLILFQIDFLSHDIILR